MADAQLEFRVMGTTAHVIVVAAHRDRQTGKKVC